MIRIRPLLLALLLFSLATIGASGQSLAPNDIKVLLERIRARNAQAPQLRADFQEDKDVHLMNKPIHSAGQVWFQEPNKFRREVKGSAPSITVSDGQQLWIYYPKFQSAERYSLGKHSPLDAGIAALTAALDLEQVENSYHISGAKTGDGYALTLAPRNPSLKRLFKTFSIHLNANLEVQRTEMLQPNGDHLVTTYSNESRAPISASTFQFAPPAGTNVTTPLGR